MRTTRIDQRLRRDFTGDSHAEAVRLIDRIGTELAAWSIVTSTDRVEAAALEYANGDLRQLAEAVELAGIDWRDLLVGVGDA